jgi:hypothetical protein
MKHCYVVHILAQTKSRKIGEQQAEVMCCKRAQGNPRSAPIGESVARPFTLSATPYKREEESSTSCLLISRFPHTDLFTYHILLLHLHTNLRPSPKSHKTARPPPHLSLSEMVCNREQIFPESKSLRQLFPRRVQITTVKVSPKNYVTAVEPCENCSVSTAEEEARLSLSGSREQ